MKKSLLVLAACAIGAIALSSCGSGYTELKLPTKTPALTEGKATFALATGTNKVLNTVTPKPTTVKMAFSGYKLDGTTAKNVKDLDSLNDIYLRESDASKNDGAKYFVVNTAASVKYNSDVIYTSFTIDIGSMKTALGTDGIDQYVLTLSLCKFLKGDMTLETKPYTYPVA